MSATDVTDTYSGRQYPLVALVDIDFDTFTVGTVYEVLKLPGNAVITSVALKVDVVWDDTTPVMAVGLLSDSSTDPDSILDGVALDAVEVYQASIYSADEEATLDESLAVIASTGDSIALAYTHASGTATAGHAYLVVEYLVPGRSNENQG